MFILIFHHTSTPKWWPHRPAPAADTSAWAGAEACASKKCRPATESWSCWAPTPLGKTQLFDVFSGVSCFVYIFCTEQMVPLFTIKTYFMIFSYPRKWIQVVQLGDWALPGRIRWYAQRRKPPFYFWVFAPLPWYQNDSWWRWEMLDPEMCTSKSPCSPRFVGQTLSYVFFG